jgi:hypothetical protein
VRNGFTCKLGYLIYVVRIVQKLGSVTRNSFTKSIYAERARNETPCDFKSRHSRVMTWQPQHSGQSLPPSPKGRDVSEDTEVE